MHFYQELNSNTGLMLKLIIRGNNCILVYGIGQW